MMTDQEKMREEFENAWQEITPDEMTLKGAARSGWIAATAHYTAEIERLRVKNEAQAKLVRVLKGALSVAVTDEMVNRFLTWKLPESVCSDPCVTQFPIGGYPDRFGTSLLTAIEARQMLEYVLAYEVAELRNAKGV